MTFLFQISSLLKKGNFFQLFPLQNFTDIIFWRFCLLQNFLPLIFLKNFHILISLQKTSSNLWKFESTKNRTQCAKTGQMAEIGCRSFLIWFPWRFQLVFFRWINKAVCNREVSVGGHFFWGRELNLWSCFV